MLSRLFSCVRSTDRGRDNLSYNPLLFEILSHLDDRSILCCKLVNRRLRDVIQSSILDLRPTAGLTMDTRNQRKREGRTDVALVDLSFFHSKHRRFHFFITESRLIVQHNSLEPVAEYLRKNCERVWYKATRGDDDYQIWNFLIQKGTTYTLDRSMQRKKRVELFFWPEYRITGLVDFLCDIFSIIGNHFELYNFTLNSHEFSQWHLAPYYTTYLPNDQLSLILDSLLKTTTCRKMTFHKWFPRFTDFYTRLGCKWLSLNAIEKLSIFFTELHTQDMFIYIYIDEAEYFDSLEPIHTILKEWESGIRKIRCLWIITPLGLDIPFSSSDLVETLRDLQCFSIKEALSPTRIGTKVTTIHIRRPMDDKIIGLKLESEFLLINESTYNYEEKEQFDPDCPCRWDYYWCSRTKSYYKRTPTPDNI